MDLAAANLSRVPLYLAGELYYGAVRGSGALLSWAIGRRSVAHAAGPTQRFNDGGLDRNAQCWRTGTEVMISYPGGETNEEWVCEDGSRIWIRHS